MRKNKTEKSEYIINEIIRFILVLALTAVFIFHNSAFSKVNVAANEVKKEPPSEEECLSEYSTESSTESLSEYLTEHPSDNISQEVTSPTEFTPSEEISHESTNIENIVSEEDSSAFFIEEEIRYEFTKAPEGYFYDALFIGDSRTVGLYEYGDIEGADFFATSGMSVYNIYDEKVKFPDKGTLSLESLISQYNYGKIYLMLGINELGYVLDENIVEYAKLVNYIREAQPEAVLYIEANLHVSSKRSDSDEIFNNKNINYINENIAAFADNQDIFYIDVNELFDDENGALRAETTFDEVHVLGRYYKQWADWLTDKAIIK